MGDDQERRVEKSRDVPELFKGCAKLSRGTDLAWAFRMPRTPRIDFPGAFHHVYARGIEKRAIFQDDGDRSELWRRVEHNLSRSNATCLAWAFLPNHFHLLFHSFAGSLSSFMRCLMSGYAMYFNRKSARAGHLFQNRYKSSLVESERYLFELIRYIHLNPVRSGIVTTLDELAAYRWTGHWEIVRKCRFPWERIPFARDFFAAGQQDNGIARYLDFVEAGIKNRTTVAFSDCEGEMRAVLSLLSDHVPGPDIPDNQRPLFMDVVGEECRKRGIPVNRLLRSPRSRIVTEVRKGILKACVLNHGMSRRAISSWLGITDSGGAYLLKRVGARDRRDG